MCDSDNLYVMSNKRVSHELSSYLNHAHLQAASERFDWIGPDNIYMYMLSLSSSGVCHAARRHNEHSHSEHLLYAMPSSISGYVHTYEDTLRYIRVCVCVCVC